MKHEDKAFFSKNIAEASKRYGVKTRDIMRTVRGYEKKSLVYDKRYVTDNKQTPFKKGYLITWFEQKGSRRRTIKEATERTNRSLNGIASTSSIIKKSTR